MSNSNLFQPTPLNMRDLENQDLRHINMQNAELPGAIWTDVKLQNANLQGANLHSAILDTVNLQRANLQDAILEDATIIDSNLEYTYFENANLQGVNFIRVKLLDTDFTNANLQNAYLHGAKFLGITFFNNAKLQGVNFEDAVLRGADLRDADFRGAHFDNTDLRGTNLAGAKLQGTNLSEAMLDGANLQGITIDSNQANYLRRLGILRNAIIDDESNNNTIDETKSLSIEVREMIEKNIVHDVEELCKGETVSPISLEDLEPGFTIRLTDVKDSQLCMSFSDAKSMKKSRLFSNPLTRSPFNEESKQIIENIEKYVDELGIEEISGGKKKKRKTRKSRKVRKTRKTRKARKARK